MSARISSSFALLCCLYWTNIDGSKGVQKQEIKMDGNITLGGLFPMHEKGEAGKICGPIKAEKGIQRVEAMLYAIDKINDDPHILPNITLGAHILDTCLRDTYALEQSLEFIKAHMSSLDMNEYTCTDGNPVSFSQRKPVAGVIGAAASPVSIMVANMLRLFQIPQISYASTGIELSDKTRFRYFSRVVPPDTYQAQAMVDIVRYFGWTYVSTVADEGNYGEKGIAAFEKKAEQGGICIAASLKIPRDENWNNYEKILRDLTHESNKRAKTVVLFVNEDNIYKLLNATKHVPGTRDIYWLASDSWGAKNVPVSGQESLAEGAVTILPQRQVLKEFDSYFTSLTPENNERNPWFTEFWESHFRCKLDSSTGRKCTGREQISDLNGYNQEGIVPFVVDAVYAMAHALHNMSLDACADPSQQLCDAMNPPEGRKLLHYILNVSFIGDEVISEDNGYVQEGLVPFVVDSVYTMAYAIDSLWREVCGVGQWICPLMLPVAGPQLLYKIRNVSFTGAAGHEVRFSEEGDPNGRYTIYQFQKTKKGVYDYVPIGSWYNANTDRLKINGTKLKWKNGRRDYPVSVCSDPCDYGYIKSSKDLDDCCWVCIKCSEYSILKDEHTCDECPNGSIPNEQRNECVPLEIEYITLDSPWAIVPVVFSILGVLLTLGVLMVFIRFNDTPVIKASGRELCYVLLIGLLLCYVMTFILVAKPTVVTCALLRLGLGLSLSLCYAALFTKTNRISRIFNRGVKAMVKRPSYTSPKSQLVICFCLVSVQVIAAITWLGMDFPGTTLVFPDRNCVVLRCKSTNVAIVLSLLYNMVLILMCTVYAVKTRKIPENFNEAKYIAFTMYSTCIVWLASIPIYFGTNQNDYKVQTTALCMCVSISATVALGCLFVPKVYLVLFQPHKNVRQGSKGAPGSSGGRPFFGRQTSRFSSLAAMNGDITSPTGLALLIAQGVQKKDPAQTPQETDKLESIKDLDSSGPDGSGPDGSGQDASDPETNL